MKARFFYWLKVYLGFSRKESKGFVLLIPVLIALLISIGVFKQIRRVNAQNFHIQYEATLDSLQASGILIVNSPFPVFNPQDTVVRKSSSKQLESLNRIPFAEADSIVLQIVPGIGQSTASRVVKFRESIGGLHSKNQLTEVYGLKPETIDAIWEYFDFTPAIFKKVKINQVELEELAKHPYCSYAEAKVLIAYRKQHGIFQSPDDFLKIRIFKQEWIDKISPYLDFQ
ncbi:DNA uptake protein ComE-like DNA-binding protein [Algoriphagus ratkowskyi]|uniref:DNA uptake protein ComE-like DNA-binding protein n=1 Tax=Algoriphagus ratkowskyi TaxID=57028 RepID=A0A2W7SE12_9BACT|nr:helix-hairpin-helix domain-containing protein [Algoriphagus ratkowskyi]PZX61075.1 DNA uptake protein ComE-like DNA-binding protein [Algoriphagus ratkowskyi]TXD79210.1 helix-hairpin-helix domain-containing protein [Algoriphagus ratkowskyi]